MISLITLDYRDCSQPLEENRESRLPPQTIVPRLNRSGEINSRYKAIPSHHNTSQYPECLDSEVVDGAAILSRGRWRTDSHYSHLRLEEVIITL